MSVYVHPSLTTNLKTGPLIPDSASQTQHHLHLGRRETALQIVWLSRVQLQTSSPQLSLRPSTSILYLLTPIRHLHLQPRRQGHRQIHRGRRKPDKDKRQKISVFSVPRRINCVAVPFTLPPLHHWRHLVQASYGTVPLCPGRFLLKPATLARRSLPTGTTPQLNCSRSTALVGFDLERIFALAHDPPALPRLVCCSIKNQRGTGKPAGRQADRQEDRPCAPAVHLFAHLTSVTVSWI